jgi:hypothetical protein
MSNYGIFIGHSDHIGGSDVAANSAQLSLLPMPVEATEIVTNEAGDPVFAEVSAAQVAQYHRRLHRAALVASNELQANAAPQTALTPLEMPADDADNTRELLRVLGLTVAGLPDSRGISW